MLSATGTCLDVVKAINYLGVIFTYSKLHIPIAKLFLAFLPHLTELRKELHVWLSPVFTKCASPLQLLITHLSHDIVYSKINHGLLPWISFSRTDWNWMDLELQSLLTSSVASNLSLLGSWALKVFQDLWTFLITEETQIGRTCLDLSRELFHSVKSFFQEDRLSELMGDLPRCTVLLYVNRSFTFKGMFPWVSNPESVPVFQRVRIYS